tara:strand:+ start:943 stop:1296 length:354 start_codon:yes stop_codon:yes gene_type:complete
MTNTTQWRGAWSVFDTEAEATSKYNDYIANIRQTPSRYVTLVPVTRVNDSTWISETSPALTDSEILEGNFTGYYTVTSQISSETFVGVEASEIPERILAYTQLFIDYVPSVLEVSVD